MSQGYVFEVMPVPVILVSPVNTMVYHPVETIRRHISIPKPGELLCNVDGRDAFAIT